LCGAQSFAPRIARSGARPTPRRPHLLRCALPVGSLAGMLSRCDRAIELRDIALGIVRWRGTQQVVRDGRPSRIFRDGADRHSLIIAYRKPAKPDMRHSLDITSRTGILKIEWWGEDHVNVLSYKRGAWERRLADMAVLARRP